MKALFIGGGVMLGLVIGLLPRGLSRPKPAWWRWLASISMAALIILAFGIPTGGSFHDAYSIVNSRSNAILPIVGTVTTLESKDQVRLDDGLKGNEAVFDIGNGSLRRVPKVIAISSLSESERSSFKAGDRVIFETTFDSSANTFVAQRVIATNPITTLSLVPGLEEQSRNIFFHVPSAWLAQVAWFVAFAYAVIYLRKRRPEDDIVASSAAAAGALFCVLATVTGSFWAQVNWGVFWNWDPRQVSIFAVLVIFGAYFALRSALATQEQRARISSIYLILLLLPVLFFLFIYPRLDAGLHPGAEGSGNMGPVLTSDGDALSLLKQAIFGLSMFAFSLLYFWMVNLSVRTRLLALRRDRQVAALEEPATAGRAREVAIDTGMIRQP